jgi:arabinogalactan oligomer/maltooligosaccharide transport system permease protein
MAVNLANNQVQPLPTAPSSPPGKNDRVAFFYLLPVILSAILLVILPFLYSTYFAFTNYSFLRVNNYRWVGLQNFREALSVANGFLPVLGWTAAWMVLSTIFNVGSGIVLAMMLNHPRLTECIARC